MSIELHKEIRKEAIESIERYFKENMEERIGNIQAGALLVFFMEEIAPSIYNKAVQDAQERLQQRVLELDIEIHEEEFGFWKKYKQRRWWIGPICIGAYLTIKFCFKGAEPQGSTPFGWGIVSCWWLVFLERQMASKRFKLTGSWRA